MPHGLRRAIQVACCAALLPAIATPLGAAFGPAKGRPPAVLDARVGPNIRLGDDSPLLPEGLHDQAEPHLVRSVANPDVLLATFQDGRHPDAGAVTCGYAISHDGGLTWRRSLVPNLTTINGGRFNRATDPVAGAGPQGDLYLQSLASVQGIFALSAIVVSRSTDNGATWSAPATVFAATPSSPAPDKNWLAVNDHAATATSGRLVTTWTGFIRNAAGIVTSSHLLASISDDRGITWSPPLTVTAVGTFHQGTQPVFLPDGSLVLVYITFLDENNATTINIECRRSADGGRTFPGAASSVVPLLLAWDDPQLRDGVFLPSAAVARSSGDLFVTYVAIEDGTPRVFVTRSADQGTSWSRPVIASDQPSGISVANPAVAVSPDGRTVSVLFMDKRDAPEGRDQVDFYLALSFDGGATWQPNLRLTEMSSEIRLGPPTPRGTMLGDYFAIAPSLAADHPSVAIWCDTRTGNSDPFVARFAPLRVPDFDAWRVAHFSRAELSGSRSSSLADADDDGVSNETEFLLATDPKRTESGEVAIVFDAENSRSIAWLQRATAAAPALTSTPLTANGGAIAFAQPGVIPSVPPPAGLRWVSYRVPANVPLRVGAHTYRDAALETNSRLTNLSTRGQAGASLDSLIVGFVIDGNKSVLIRAAGPALAALGVRNVLANPRLTLSAPASDLERSNDNWDQDGGSAALFQRVGAFPFPPNSLDAALSLPLGPQSYTAVISGADGTGGVTLVEAYDADVVPGAPSGPRFVNLSARGEVGTGENSLIAGFALVGSEPRRVLIRAIGPGLAQFGLARGVADPVVTLYRGATPVAENDDWEISRSAAAIAVTARRLGAFPLARAARDAALLLTLAPGSYTVNVSSADGGPGIALIEIYDAN